MYVCLFSSLSARKQTVYFNFKLPWTFRPRYHQRWIPDNEELDPGNIREEDGLKGEIFGGKEIKSGSVCILVDQELLQIRRVSKKIAGVVLVGMY